LVNSAIQIKRPHGINQLPREKEYIPNLNMLYLFVKILHMQ
jgi:hypothetical protein